MAPRLGAAYDVWGDGRAKVFASWGRYYDWTKYESPRGSFGAETWCIYYRGLNTLDLGSLSVTNTPGPDLWITPGTCRDRRVPSFQNSIDPDTKPMSQDSTSAGLEYQLGKSSVLTAHYIHNNLRTTIEDIGFLDPTGNEGYLYSNPGEGLTKFEFPTGKTPPGQLTPKPIRKYDALELGYSRRYCEQLVLQRQLHAEPAVGQLLGHRQLGRNHWTDNGRDVSGLPTAVRHDRAPRRQREPGVGSGRVAVGCARSQRRRGATRHRSAARCEVVRVLPGPVQDTVRRVLPRLQWHAYHHVRDEHATPREALGRW